MRLIVGLGNPGKKYENTRHNLGFTVVSRLAKNNGLKFKRSVFLKSLVAKGTIESEDVLLVLPQTFMNNSGSAVRRIVKKKNINADNILIVCDDVNLGLGDLRLRPGGSDGGHNGLHSVIEHMANKDIARLRLGIDHPKKSGDLVNFVLSDFGKKEKKELDSMIDLGADCCAYWVKNGTSKTMSMFNKREKR